MSQVLRIVLAMLAVAGCAPSASDTSAAASATAESSTTVAAAVVKRAEPVAPSAPSSSRPLRVLVGGDLIPHRPSLVSPSAIVDALAPLAPLFSEADAVVANYEAATGELDKKAFRLAYAAPPAWLASLPATGINAVTVANNHACDLGHEGVETTLATASKAGLIAVGGDMGSDPWAPRTLVERDGKRVCAVAWTTFVNAQGGCAKTSRLAIAREDAAGRRAVAAAVKRATSTCDATIAIFHGGEEYVRQTPAVMRVARQAAEAGAAAVVIHHPHVASPVVVHRTKDGRRVPIFASIGNLVSNQGESWKPPMFPVLRENRRLVCVNGWTRLGVLADLSFSFGETPRLDWSFHLTWTDNDHAENKSPLPKIATRVLDPDEDGAILSRLSDDRKGPVALFDDPCWVERPIADEAARAPHPRCSTSLVPTPERGTVARARKKR